MGRRCDQDTTSPSSAPDGSTSPAPDGSTTPAPDGGAGLNAHFSKEGSYVHSFQECPEAISTSHKHHRPYLSRRAGSAVSIFPIEFRVAQVFVDISILSSTTDFIHSCLPASLGC